MSGRRRAHGRWLPAALLALALLPALCVSAGRAVAADEPPAPAAVFPDSLLLQAPDFAALRPDLLPLTTARVAETAWDLVPRLVYADRPDLLVDFLDFWEDRCGRTEPIARTRILAAIWDGAFDESLYDEGIGGYLDDWEGRDPSLMTSGHRDFDAFTTGFADQLLPHQEAGSLPEYFCLLYSDRLGEADAALSAEAMDDTWLAWYLEHPEGGDGGEVIPAAGDEAAAVSISASGPTLFMLTTGTWQPLGDVRLAGSHVLVGGLVEQRLGAWFLRVPIEVRLGRTDRPYQVDQDGVRARSDRFDAIYLGVEVGRGLARAGSWSLEGFAGLGYDGVRPFLKQDIYLATLNVNLGLGLRRQAPGSPWVLGLDARREWLGTRNEGPDSLGGGAWSLRLGTGLRFGPGA